MAVEAAGYNTYSDMISRRVVACLTAPQHFVVIYPVDACPGTGVMAGITEIAGCYVVGWFIGMTAGAHTDDFVMVYL